MRTLSLLLAGFVMAGAAAAANTSHCPDSYYELDLIYNTMERGDRVVIKRETVAVRATTINRLYVKGVDCSSGDKVKIPREWIEKSRANSPSRQRS